jgi:hypothetical protein
MKSQALQELVRKIFSDDTIRKQFESDPDGYLAKCDLSEQEKKAVLSVQSKLGTVSSGSPQFEAIIDAKDEWFGSPLSTNH